MERRKINPWMLRQHGRRPKPSEKPIVRRPMGRPSTYREYYAVLVYKLRLLGCGEERIADILEVQPGLLLTWLRDIPDLRQAWIDGGETADANVAHSVYHRATGYSHQAQKLWYDNKSQRVIRADYTEHYPPDITAAMHWLNNRQPELWKKGVGPGSGEPTVIVPVNLPPPSILIMPVQPMSREVLESRPLAGKS